MDRFSLSVSAARVNRKFINISSCASIELFVARRSNYTGRVLEFRPARSSPPIPNRVYIVIGRRTRVAGRKVVPRGRDRYREIVQSLETESKLGNFVHHLNWNNAISLHHNV